MIIKRIIFILLFLGVSSLALIQRQSDNSMYLFTSANAGITISQNGNVGIGTTAPSTKLDVAGTVSASALQINGDISYTGGIYDLSDRRQKEHITSLTHPLEMIKAISGVYYNMTSTPTKREVGVIAQDVETVLPEAIHIAPDGIKSVDYTRLVPLLLEAIKAQQKQIDILRDEVSVLQKKQ